MAKFKLTADFDENQVVIEIAKSIVKQFNEILFSMKNDGVLKNQVNDFIDRQIRSSSEFFSLLNGELKEAFGLVDAGNATEAIIDTIKRSSIIDITPAKLIGKNVVGANIKVSILRDDFEDVLSLQSSFYESSGGQVDWLNWLLIRGDAIVLANYSLRTNILNSNSRTGDTIMVKSNQGFRVPPEYAGNARDNWLTRCFDETEEIVENIIRVELIRRFL